ncbi:MAG: alpha-D-ribose 1-methylphosphonate 5-triphosphate diphosphatase, partial [Paracoccaceae bacterium]
MDWVLKGGHCLEDGKVVVRDLGISDGWITEKIAPDARVFDASGFIVAPGIVDLHGDGFERNMSPRPGVMFDLDTALVETDRQLVANGITTAYLAMTISWEPGLRSLEQGRKLVEALTRMRPYLLCDIRLQLRWEVFALEAVEQIEAWLDLDPTPMLAFNDHFTGMLKGGREAKDVSKYAARSGMTMEQYNALTERTRARADDVPGAIARLSRAARARGVPMLAHDEKTVEVRARNRAMGITISEFPLTREAAADAVAAGEPTILGAPNVLRGGSHIKAVDAEPAVRDGLCRILASDYYYPSLMRAVLKMAQGDLGALAQNWPLISENPAACVAADAPVGLARGA